MIQAVYHVAQSKKHYKSESKSDLIPDSLLGKTIHKVKEKKGDLCF